MRVCFVGYRDIKDHPRFSIKEFSEDLDDVKKFISSVNASGGGDFPEDVQGGFHKALGMAWEAGSVKTAFHIFDAPGHGKDICPNGGDDYPAGSPEGHKIQDQMQKFAEMKINFTCVKVNEQCNAMIKVMQDSYAAGGMNLNVTDLAKAMVSKSHAEVTKDFVTAATSYILSVTDGGKGAAAGKKGGAAPAGKVVRKGAPLWDPKQLAVGQWLSQTQYYNVTAIDGTRITVKNQWGNLLYVSKDIIEKMWSATHFEKEVPMNMTALAELLESVSDTVISVHFKKQASKENAEDLLKETKMSDLKDKAKIASLTKDLIEGAPCSMICHLVKAESNLGRSTVIDLSTDADNKFRQVDHRTIESVIYQNVKYVLKKGAKKVEAEEEKKGGAAAAKWDASKIAVGNWFSGTSYFKVQAINGNEITTTSDGKSIVVSRDILEYEMYNAGVFQKEEKLALTKVVKILKEAYSTVFTVCFTCKVDEKAVQERLAKLTEKELKDVKTLAKELLTGRESTITGKLSSTEGKLGRSLVRAFDGSPFAQVDHRTIKYLILKNVKYVVNSH